jgi:pSer/pThr/pTyr-binding forkhead associated (FHA) protein
MNPIEPNRPSPASESLSREIVGALGYLDQSLADRRPFAALVTDAPHFAAEVVRSFLKSHEAELRCLRVPAPTDSAHTFLQTLLIELGFDPVESTVDDLQRLLLVVFRQAQTEATRCVVLLEQAQEFGPRVFEALRDLLRNLATLRPAPLLVLTGTGTLDGVLDSRGMASIAHLTRLRFDTTRRPQADTSAPERRPLRAIETPAETAPEEVPNLTILLGDRWIDRIEIGTERLMIGRSIHNDINLPDRFVSRHHAMIMPGPAGLTLMDLKSTNGTFVNSRAIRTRVLQDGDWVHIGNYRLHFTDPRPQAVATPQVLSDPQSFTETLVMRSVQGIGNARDADDEPDAEIQRG